VIERNLGEKREFIGDMPQPSHHAAARTDVATGTWAGLAGSYLGTA
jgi:hypothetical protein